MRYSWYLRIQRVRLLVGRTRFSMDGRTDGRTDEWHVTALLRVNAVMSGMRLAGDNRERLFFAALARGPFRDLLARKEA